LPRLAPPWKRSRYSIDERNAFTIVRGLVKMHLTSVEFRALRVFLLRSLS
jgi:hypothetical protein